jgi:hypothetical protein
MPSLATGVSTMGSRLKYLLVDRKAPIDDDGDNKDLDYAYDIRSADSSLTAALASTETLDKWLQSNELERYETAIFSFLKH